MERAGRSMVIGYESYLDLVADRLLDRAGAGPQGKGIAHELMFVDLLNAKSWLMAKSERFRLVESANARCADVVGFVPGQRGLTARFQLKDCTSTTGIRDTLTRIERQQYRNVRMVGTPETTAAFTKAGGQAAKKMSSSGISSNQTLRAARRGGCKVRSKNADRLVGQDIARASAGAAALAGMLQFVTAMKTGQDRGVPLRASFLKASTSGLKASSETALKTAAGSAAKELATRWVPTLMKKSTASGVIFLAVDQLFDTGRLLTGRVDKKEYVQRTCQNVGGTGGSLAGAALGSLIPGPGTVLGGMAGGLIGSFLADAACPVRAEAQGRMKDKSEAPRSWGWLGKVALEAQERSGQLKNKLASQARASTAVASEVGSNLMSKVGLAG